MMDLLAGLAIFIAVVTVIAIADLLRPPVFGGLLLVIALTVLGRVVRIGLQS